MPNEETLETLLVRKPSVRTRTRTPYITTALQHHLEELANTITEEAEIRGRQFGKELVRLSFFPYDITKTCYKEENSVRWKGKKTPIDFLCKNN